MNFSYWEKETWFKQIDFTIIGSGITGLSCALQLRKNHPNAKILILERGLLPNGASTKNAGFACFGSASELLDDLKNHSKEEMIALVQHRVGGLQLLRETIGDTALEFKSYGGYELFTEENKTLFKTCVSQLDELNNLLFPIFKKKVFSVVDNNFGFKKIQQQLIFNQFEGQLNTGKMMQALVQKVHHANIQILNGVEVLKYEENQNSVKVITKNFELETQKLCIATNGFAKKLNIDGVKPARAQVLITKPIKNLHIKGTFHLEEGYYYFRNIDNRILLGGGRNLAIKDEETTQMAQTTLIQRKLEELLREVILPETSFEIDQRWSGIMGVGNQKKPLLKNLSPNVFCGVRLGGMGVAMGSLVGKELANLAT
ncbi:FAD-dependent oxidoreductase [Mesonia sp. MT50]|uniref:FAD-dependent oxidoreductase n=1 Tax=Mesonia profundi TaxID=3070998 RepID=A0ABU0ZYZ6_9FLAO|nr:FAD-dependent oxidoreductase [Mesonia profundi]MDQ7916685.1 FAD-dependent oxidoreductase [Mesonia profundi]